MGQDNTKEVPLAAGDKRVWNVQRKKFFFAAFLRFIAIGLMLLFVHWGLRNWLSFDAGQIKQFGVLFNGIFIAITIGFIGVVIYLHNRDFKLPGTKLVTTGVLKEKQFSSYKHELDRYEVDRDKKTLKLWLTDKHGGIGGAGYKEWKYDKKDFEGYLEQGEYLVFHVNNLRLNVDVKHFAEFNEGENITVE